jgi:hypothetical protein
MNSALWDYVRCQLIEPFIKYYDDINFELRDFFWHIITVVLFVIFLTVILEGEEVSRRAFFEGDLSQSYVCIHDQVPSSLLYVLSSTVPLGLSALLVCINLPWKDSLAHVPIFRKIDCQNRGSYSFSIRVRIWVWFFIGLIQVVAMEVAIITVVKKMAGRHRPCFFYLCDYKGYRSAFESNNYTAYNAAITRGAPGDYTYCAASSSDIDNAQKSFPSGHSGMAFATMGFTFFFLKFAFGEEVHVLWSWKCAFAGLPLLLAGYIALTRVQDYKV